jgi:hypothetical protein
MSEAGGDWRDGAAYDFVDALAPEQLPFEFLRRNPEYVADYPGLTTEPDDEVPPPALTRWGLRFCRRPFRLDPAGSTCVVAKIRRGSADTGTCSAFHIVRSNSRARDEHSIGFRG